MKKTGLLLLLIITIVSCSNDKDNDNKQAYHGKWTLTGMTRNENPAANYINVFEWQESYTFNPDNTFSKTRKKDDKTTTISGTYSVVKALGQTQLELTYTAQNDIIGSCTNLKENLYVIDYVGNMFSTWRDCDGPSLTYSKTK